MNSEVNNCPETINAATSAKPPVRPGDRGAVLTPHVGVGAREDTSPHFVRRTMRPEITRRQEDLTLEEKVAKILARAQTPPKPGPTVTVLPKAEPEHRAGGELRARVFAGLALLVALGAGLSPLYLKALDRVTAASAERLGTEAEWTAISTDLQKALAELPELARSQSLPARIAADRAKPRWTPVLCGIVPSDTVRIDILEVDARGEPGDSGACHMSVRGVADGPQPRLMADQFRRAVEDNLKRAANGRPVSTHFERLKDAPDASLEQARATFDLIATLGPMPSVAPRKEKR